MAVSGECKVLAPGVFLGTSSRAWSGSGFSLSQWTASGPPPLAKPHMHEEAHFMFVIAGSYETRAVGPQT